MKSRNNEGGDGEWVPGRMSTQDFNHRHVIAAELNQCLGPWMAPHRCCYHNWYQLFWHNDYCTPEWRPWNLQPLEITKDGSTTKRTRSFWHYMDRRFARGGEKHWTVPSLQEGLPPQPLSPNARNGAWNETISECWTSGEGRHDPVLPLWLHGIGGRGEIQTRRVYQTGNATRWPAGSGYA